MKLRTMISELHDVGIHVDFIITCETFLNYTNMYTVPIDGYQFAGNNILHGRGAGVAIYIADTYPFQIRNYLTMNHYFQPTQMVENINEVVVQTIIIYASYNNRWEYGSCR